MTLKQLRSEIDSDELPLWMAYHKRYGFPLDRIAGAVAISGANLAQCWGAKVKPVDNLPVFGDQGEPDPVTTAAQLRAWAAMQNKYPKPPAQLTRKRVRTRVITSERQHEPEYRHPCP